MENDILKDYLEFTRSTAIYPKDQELTYCALGLGDEAGEVQGKVKKYIRDGFLNVEDVIKELGDVAWYLTRIADHFDVSLEEVLERNMEKLSSRKARGVLGGSGDNR